MNRRRRHLGLEYVLSYGKKYTQFQPTLVEQQLWCGDCLIVRTSEGILCFRPQAGWQKEVLLSSDDCRQLINETKKGLLTLLDAQGNDLLLLAPRSVILFNLETKQVSDRILLRKGDRNFCYHFSSKQLALTNNGKLYLLKQGKRMLIARHSNKAVTYAPDEIYRREFGTKQTMFWDQKGEQLAFYELDESNIPELVLQSGKKKKTVRYPFAGEKNQNVRLCIYDCLTGKKVWIQELVQTDQYLIHPVFINKDELLLTRLNRHQKLTVTAIYNTRNGERKSDLFSETDEKYVEPQVGPCPLLNDHRVIVESRISGYNQLYLFDLDSQEREQLTGGDFEVTKWVGYDSANRMVYYQKAAPTPLQLSLYRKSIVGGKEELLVQGGGIEAMLSCDGAYTAFIEKSHQMLPVLAVLDNQTGEKHILLTSFVPQVFRMPDISVGELLAEDGTILYWRMIKPLGFNSKKKYPVIVYLYGGPHVQMISDIPHWGARGWDLYMAEQGYILFTIDNRGSSCRGKVFEQITHKRLGEVEREDQITGINFLKSHPFVDENRIGIFGWSFGGFMSLNMKFHYPDLFRVCVAGAPVTYWQGYEIMYGERYMETPKENPIGYQDSDLLPLVKYCHGKMMLIHGELDDVVLPMHSSRIVEEAEKENVLIDFVSFPHHGHHVLGRDQIKLYKKITNYFIENL